MSLLGLASHPFTLVKRDGSEIPFKGQLSPKLLISYDSNLPVEDGDTVRRDLPNGNREQFLIKDTGFHPGSGHGIGPHFQMKVEKLGLGARSTQPNSQTIKNVYNVEGPNSRITLNGIDASSNIASVGEKELFEKLRAAITVGVLAQTQRDQMLEAISDLERSAGTPAFSEHFQKLLAVSANVMTILTPFLPALGQLAASAMGRH